MSSDIDISDVEKVSKGYRALSGFMFFCGLFAIVGMLAFSSKEDLTLSSIPLYVMPFVMVYITAKITFTGYPPRSMLWMLQRKNNPGGF